MKILWRYLRPLRGRIAISLLLAGAAQILELVDPLILGRIIDDYVLDPAGRPEGELVRGALGWLGIAVGIALAARLAKTCQDYVLAYVVQSSGRQLFDDGLRQTLRLTYQEYEDSSSGETVALLQKVRNDTERFINAGVNVLFSTIVGMGFLIWYAVAKHWLLIPVFFIGVLVLGGLTGLLSRQIRTTQRAIVRETRRMYGTMTESLRNVELVKSLGLTFPEIRRMQGYTQRIFDLEMEKVRRVRTLAYLQGAIINLLKQSILFILLWLIFRAVLSAGELVSLQIIINAIFGPLQQIGSFILQYREAEAALQSFELLMQKSIERRPDEPVEIGELESLRFEKVVFRHRKALANAIDGISFGAKLGDTIAFVGPSGSGKSTLVKLLVGLYTPIEGTIYIDDVPVNALRYNPVRRQIGFVTQDPQLFSGTIRENLQFVKPDATDEDLLAALAKASALGILERAANGLDSRLGEGGTRLSGGERQRVAIARALLRDPRLLIFDEATSALDSLTEKDITAVIRGLSADRRRIVLLIAHRLSTIAHADTIYVLEKGRVVETGTHEDLLERLGLYFAMWRQQIGERDLGDIRPEEPAASPARPISDPEP
ncbi:MAG TPA: ABC transporter ATP-binding protein [Candidatus Krumholzibacteria bacterium]|nr:ABC transporter ATP-binding protein [Candidatus Krumholzibacteria bacterium]HPD71928.1 ABC transporter ATP-binding protein [Candidatus Krumholzibacteria bacterium]HRY41139.1 ABC transporter ATP-binding protein [Candidatus Krumholzibacteria bacterium]